MGSTFLDILYNTFKKEKGILSILPNHVFVVYKQSGCLTLQMQGCIQNTVKITAVFKLSEKMGNNIISSLWPARE
jgi:hypothetical protein